MRKIRNTMLFLHALLLSALFLAGCVREEFPGSGSVAEGKPSQVAFNLVIPAMSSSPSTRAMTPEEERKIENLRVMVFRADGSVVSNDKYAGTGNQFTVNSYSGNGYTLLFIANVNSAEIEARLQSAASLSDMEQFVTTATQQDFGLNTTHPLMMIGKQENVTFAPGNSTYGTPVQLHFIAAKVTVKVIDNTPFDHGVSIIGWDVENAPARSYLFPQTADINQPGTTDSEKNWLTTDVDYPFEAEDKLNKTVSQTLYVFENRRGGRVDRNLPSGVDDKYHGMAFNDQDHRGKGWFKPVRATAIVIKAMHKTTLETKQVKAHIYLGADNHSDYNIERGKHYTFTVTVNGMNDIKVDTNIDYAVGDFLVDHGDNLTMDAHPDFRPMRIHAPRGVVTMEILDNVGRDYSDPNFDATWLKISPLDLMWHQVKQSPPNDKWQQQAEPESRMVRPKYIPHKSVRAKLQAQGITGWNAVPTGKEDDDAMTFADATYRMCYKITDIPFTEVTVTNKTLHVYADELLVRDGKRSAQVRFTFYKDGGDSARPEIRTFHINQEGYISPFLDDTDPDAGLWIANEDGTPSSVRNKFVVEREVELRYALYPGLEAAHQSLNGVAWGFYGNVLYYYKADRFVNGKFMTANLVYNDVQRVDNEPVGFGKASKSYRQMYDGIAIKGLSPIGPYSGQTSGLPYYYPRMGAGMCHSIYKTSAARYCHEKNRDVNGDGIIDDSETFWYLPSRFELSLLWVAGVKEINNLPQDMSNAIRYGVVTEYFFGPGHYQDGWFAYGKNLKEPGEPLVYRDESVLIPRCIRAL